MLMRWASYIGDELVSTSLEDTPKSRNKHFVNITTRLPYFIVLNILLLLSGFMYSTSKIRNGFNNYYLLCVMLFLFILIIIIVRQVFSLKWKLKFYEENNLEIITKKMYILLKIFIMIYLSGIISGGYLFLMENDCIIENNLRFPIINFLIIFEEYTFCQSTSHKIIVEIISGLSIFCIQLWKGGNIQETCQIVIEVLTISLILRGAKTYKNQTTKSKELKPTNSKLEKAIAEFYKIVKVPLIIIDSKFNILEKNSAFYELMEDLSCPSEIVLFEKLIDKDNLSLKENIETSCDMKMKPKNFQSIYYIKYPSESKLFFVVNQMDIVIPEDNIKYFHMSISEITEEISNVRNYVNESNIISIDSIAHEFNTPLNGIIGLLQALSKMTIGEVNNYIKIAKSCSIILSSQINNLIDIFQIRKGQFLLHMSNFNIHILIGKIAKFASNFLLSKDSKVLISAEISNEVPSSITGDSERLRQIIFNLILNSAKHTKIGTIKIMGSMQNSNELLISVADTGEGMSSELVNSINNKSRHRTSKKIIFSDQKLGFKLRACQSLLIEMDSKLLVTSYKGTGTTFSFRIPLSSSRAKRKNYNPGLISGITFYEDSTDNEYTLTQKIAQYTHNTLGHTMLSIKRKFEPAKVISHGPFQPLKSSLSISSNVVLIVDDSDLNRYVLHAICERFPNYEIAEAVNGEEAMIKAKLFEEQHRLKVIFMDVDMPVMNGIESTIKIREFSSCLIVALTSFSSEEVRSKCLNAGMNIFLTKPISYRDVKMLFSSL